MSAVAIDNHLHRAHRFYQASIGKKVLMALTGVVLFGYVVGHLIGNLQIYAGPEKLNNYAAFLHSSPALLWGTRSLLLICVTLHIIASIQLARLKQEARPIGYVKKENPRSSYASRTMMWSGPIIAAFVIYHLLDFTFGVTNTAHYEDLQVYANVVWGFRRIPVSAAYIVAMLLLGMHLYHGLFSMFQSLGVNHPRYTPWFKRFAAFATAFIVIGNISIPIAVLTGAVGSQIR
jgi:succinate dehydrogenase / fumarate reductase cytochrome b subunit